MAAPILVDADVEMGLELIEMLDKAAFPVTAAVWIYSASAEEWRLFIRTPKAEKDLLGALLEVANTMDAQGDLRSRIDLARIKLVPPSDIVLAAMNRQVIAEGTVTLPFARNVIDGILIDDALIYRLAA